MQGSVLDNGMNIVAHNLLAMNAQRQYGLNATSKAKSAEKLASGFKVNRAADDAASLTISEKMRSQIRGLNQGCDNIQDGISFLQIADGAMGEVHDILDRLTELAVKASNGTNTTEDRLAIDSETQALTAEIDRIHNSTEFNTLPVFFESGKAIETMTPTATSKFFQVMAGSASTSGYMNEKIEAADLSTLNYTRANNIDDGNPFVGVHIDFNSIINTNHNIEALKDTQFYVNCCTDCCPAVVNFTDSIGTNVSYDTPSANIERVINIGLKKEDGTYYTDAAEFCKNIVDSLKAPIGSDKGQHVEFANDGTKLYIFDVDPNNWTEHDKQLAYFCDTSNFYNPGTMVTSPLWIQASGSNPDGMYITTGLVDSKSLGIGDIKMDPIEKAKESIEKIKEAISRASRIRSGIGAQQNRLESAYNRNMNTAENTQAAESVIRDTNMAKEMVSYSMANILEQVGQSMMAQANQSTQGILNLLS